MAQKASGVKVAVVSKVSSVKGAIVQKLLCKSCFGVKGPWCKCCFVQRVSVAKGAWRKKMFGVKDLV